MQRSAGRKAPRRGATTVARRLAPILLLLFFCAYGLWAASVLRSQDDTGTAQQKPVPGFGARPEPPLGLAAQPERFAAATPLAGLRGTAGADPRAPGSQTRSAAAAAPGADGVARGSATVLPVAQGAVSGRTGHPAAAPVAALPAESAAPSPRCNYSSSGPPSGTSAEFASEADAITLGLLDGPDRPAMLDNQALTLGVWVYVSAGSESIQTVVSSKAAGCDANPSHYGFALFVNEWQTASQQAWLSWGNEHSGCEELGSARQAVPYTTWTHLAAVFEPHADGEHFTARVYVNGALSASTEKGGPGSAKISTALPSRPLVQPGHETYVGVHADKTHPFHGAMDELAVWHGVLSASELVEQVVSCEPPPAASAILVARERFEYASERADVAKRRARTKASSAFANKVSVPAAARSAQTRVTSALKQSEIKVARTWTAPPTDAERKASDELAVERLEAVRRGFKHAWDGYKRYAWGQDELKPKSNTSKNWLHQAATMIDSLDCLWIMGFKEDFYEARDWIKANLHFDFSAGVSVFETIIRSLGGLLSAYDLSRDHVFLDKAVELADVLLKAFTSPTGLPCTTLNFKTGACTFPSWTGGAAILSEFGTIQLEFKYLTQHTGDPKYADAALRVMSLVRSQPSTHGMYPTYLNAKTGKFSNAVITFGALGDSFYEYLIKQWVQTGKREPWLRKMYDDAMDGLTGYMLQRSTPGELLYVADYNGRAYNHKMDHLVCFVGAMLALGARDGHPNDEQHLAVAEGLTETCYQMYARQPTGLSPEFVTFAAGNDFQVPNNAKFNILRPEAIESIFYLHYYTRQPRYREQGWAMFQAFEQWSRTPSGYAAIPNVLDTSHKQDDKMESFWLAETMKYFYLLFDSSDPIPLDKYVFNTEAHPLSVFEDPADAVLGVRHGIE